MPVTTQEPARSTPDTRISHTDTLPIEMRINMAFPEVNGIKEAIFARSPLQSERQNIPIRKEAT